MRSLMTAGGAYERGKERVWLKRLGFEFRMKLAAQEPRVIGHLDNLHIGGIWRAPADAQTRRDELLLAELDERLRFHGVRSRAGE